MPFPLQLSLKKLPESPTDPNSSLRLPAQRRVSLPTSQRLSTIAEGLNFGNLANGPPIPPRSHLRNSASTQATSARTAPPPYTWVPDVDDGEDSRLPVEGEKVRNLRKGDDDGKGRRGGWLRLATIVAIFLAIVALAVGLGVGLTTGKRKHNDGAFTTNTTAAGGPGSASPGVIQAFPLGEYSFVTALRSQQTNCTSNAATWRCYPYSVFNPSDSSSANSSQATFNWIITNTSSAYATNATTLTPASGTPANLTISSTNNPFALAFTNVTLTYINSSENSSATRYDFSFTLPKAVVPTPSITKNNAASQCFFNRTVVTGSLYLTARRTFPAVEARSSGAALGGYEQWPYAVEISQVSPGGQGTPDCYETFNGGLGDRITTGLTAQAAGEECSCDYRNF